MDAHPQRPWPWPRAHARLHQQMLCMQGVLAGLPVLGWEVSCKLGPRGIAPGRLVAGFSPDGVTERRLARLPQALGMPEALAQRFRAQLPQSRAVLLACEATPSRTVGKVYLEFPVPLSDRRAALRPCLAIRGFKWPLPPADAPAVRETEYWRMNPLGLAEAIALLREPAPADAALAQLYAWLADALALARQRTPTWERHQLMFVREPSSPRSACGVRLYDSGLRVRDLAAGLMGLGRAWGLARGAMEQLFEAIGERELGWLHSGIGSEGEPFATLYCAAGRLDAEQAVLISDPARAAMAAESIVGAGE